MIGKIISHYKILEKIGEGGMGVVYKAQDAKLSREVAIKVLPEEFKQDLERLSRFKREAKLLASLNHPNIAAIYGLEDYDDVHFLILELVEGETLAERLSDKKLEEQEALEICRQVAEALETAHERGIIHRDLKPSNIKVTPEGKAKVLDFGIAKAFATADYGEVSDVDLTKSPTLTVDSSRTGIILGTAAYMSPEQARGKPLDKRTDIWSFGCVLYEALTGRQAFKGETVSDTVASILKQDPDWSELPESTPVKIRELLQRCLRKDKNRRVHDVADARIEIEDALHKDSAPLKAVSKTKYDFKSDNRWRLTIFHILLAFITAVITGIVVYFLARAPSSDISPNVPPVIVLMDSSVPERVYDPETRRNRGTNADDITDILRDLPVVIHKETTSSVWHREDQVLKQNSDLIIIHRSCFFDATSLSDNNFFWQLYGLADSKLIAFLGYIALGNPNTKFLIYSRGFTDLADPELWTSEVEKRFHSLKGRITAWPVPGKREEATFRDAKTAKEIKLKVRFILNLE